VTVTAPPLRRAEPSRSACRQETHPAEPLREARLAERPRGSVSPGTRPSRAPRRPEEPAPPPPPQRCHRTCPETRAWFLSSERERGGWGRRRPPRSRRRSVAAAGCAHCERLIYSQIPPSPQLLHDLIYVDNPVTFRRDKSWGLQYTGYAGVLPIGHFRKFSLISRRYGDRSPIHMPYDYE